MFFTLFRGKIPTKQTKRNILNELLEIGTIGARIFFYLEFLDILHLKYVCKSIRRHIYSLTRSSTLIWIHTIHKVYPDLSNILLHPQTTTCERPELEHFWALGRKIPEFSVVIC
jgi:hypothetical protein